MLFAFLQQQIIDYAESHLPPAVYDSLKTVIASGQAVYLYLYQYLPEGSGFRMESLLPGFISLIMLFLTIRSLYRSTMFAIRTAWWILKWSTIVGGVAYMFGGNQLGGGLQQIVGGLIGRQFNNNPNMGHNMADWLDEWFTSPVSQPRRKTRTRTARQAKAQSRRPLQADRPPTVFDSFEAHRAYAARAQERLQTENRANQEGSGNLEQVYEQVQGVWAENGKKWWETVGRMAGFVDDEEDEITSQSRRRTRHSKEKEKITRSR